MLGRSRQLAGFAAVARGGASKAFLHSGSVTARQGALKGCALLQKVTDYHRGGEESGELEKDDGGGEEARHVLRWLDEHATNQGHRGEARQRRVEEMVKRYVEDHEPLAYIIGSQPFGPIDILCQRPTLIPRPETEFLAEHAATLVIEALQQQPVEKTAASPPPPPLRILDLCTGSGCIALLLHHRLKEAGIPVEITAADKKEESLRLASRNIHALQAAQSVHTAKVDLFNDDEFTRLCRRKGPFDLIVSNPPYIPALEWHTLKKNVREWEDSEALLGDVDGRGDGLAFYRRIAALAAKKNVLSLRFSEMPNLVLEVGHKQAERVRDIMVESDCFSKTAIWDDPWKISRGVLSWSSR